MTQLPVYTRPPGPWSEAETRYPWLSPLLDAYYISDEISRKSIRDFEERTGKKLACHKGCSLCCTHADILLTKPEFLGVSWYIEEILSNDLWKRVFENFKNLKKTRRCPFLLDDACAIHPMRSVMCREYNVVGEPCRLGAQVSIDGYRKEDLAIAYFEERILVAERLLAAEGISEHLRERYYYKGYTIRSARSIYAARWDEVIRKMKETAQDINKIDRIFYDDNKS